MCAILKKAGDSVNKYSLPREYEEKEAIFYDRIYYVDERVYIPTIETERLVYAVVKSIRACEKPVVLDVGCGSCALAITLQKEVDKCIIYASDVCLKALEVAKINIARHKVPITLFQSNYVDDVPLDVSPTYIIANLPWGDVESKLTSMTSSKLFFMPQKALHHSKGVLGAYRELVDSIKRKQWKVTVFIEVGRISEREVRRIFCDVMRLSYIQITKHYAAVRMDL